MDSTRTVLECTEYFVSLNLQILFQDVITISMEINACGKCTRMVCEQCSVNVLLDFRWHPNTIDRFIKKSKCMIDQYSNYTVVVDEQVINVSKQFSTGQFNCMN